MEVFNNNRTERTTLISCLDKQDMYLPGYIYMSVGYCIVCRCYRSFHNLLADKRKSAPHFLFCILSGRGADSKR